MKGRAKLLIIGVLTLLMVACSSSDAESVETSGDPTGDEKDHLVLALGTEPEDGFDPTTGWGRYGSPLFQSTLLRWNKDFDIEFDLAEDYEVSEDGLEWTLSIRDDVMFSDGEPLAADDVAFTYETAKQQYSIVDLQNLKNVEVFDTNKVRFTLAKPQSTFIYMLAMIGIVPEHAYSEMYNEEPIGSGPYQIVQWDKGQQLIVEENPHYYGEKGPFKKITFLFLEEDAAFTAAKAGQVDMVAVPAHFANEEVAGMELISLDTVDNRGIMFPYVERKEDEATGLVIGHDVTSDIAIRKAINKAVDREKLINDVLDGFGTPAYSVADHLPWWNEETVVNDGNQEKAEEILKVAGWQKNEQGIFEKDGIEASFTLIYPANDQTRQSLSMIFAQTMKEFGIDVKTEGKSWSEIPDLMYSTPVMMGWGSQDPIEMYNIYHSESLGVDNSNYYHNPQVDEYLDLALQATTEEEANGFLKQAQWDGETGFSTNGDAPWAWLVNLQHLYFVNEDLDIGEQKIQPHGHGWPITEFITDWKRVN